ncbi:uncharacterized protein LOC133305757, partial [Gastrolobium bilobum]|uniref:uncharacterized protein LOC133305757 n=1 Tax=Gastrolobium bilobum TaxID=150636 RepID=UPI002AAFA680
VCLEDLVLEGLLEHTCFTVGVGLVISSVSPEIQSRDTTQPIPEDLKRTVIGDVEEEAPEVPQKKTTKATPSKSSTSAHVPARRTVPPPTKVKKDAPIATESKQGKKKSPAKSSPRKGERSSQRLKRTFSSTKKAKGASSEKPITLSDKEEERDDNEPLAKRLKGGRTSVPKPAAKETSRSSSATIFSDVPSPPPAHSPPTPITPQPSLVQQQGEERIEKEAAPAAETSVAEQKAQPQKKNNKGKGILVESPKKKKKPSVPRQISLGGPLLYPVNRPDTTGDEALARALAEEEGMAVPPLMKEPTETIPSSSRPPEDEPRPTPVAPPVVSSSHHSKQTTSSLVTAIPLPTKKKSQIGIAEIFEMMGKRIEKLLPAKQSVPQTDMTSTNEELKALRDRLGQLSSCFNTF